MNKINLEFSNKHTQFYIIIKKNQETRVQNIMNTLKNSTCVRGGGISKTQRVY